MDLVSIIMPVFNSEKYISEAIHSVLNQTHTHWELLLVDDASHDKSIEIIQVFCANDNRIKYFQNAINQGAGFSRNEATKHANGKYIAFLDADDMWLPTKLEKQIAFMKQKNLVVTYSFYEWINEEAMPLQTLITAPKTISKNQLYYCNWVGNLTGIYNVEVLGKIEISTLKKRQDWILWQTIIQKTNQIEVVPEVLAYYRKRTDSISSNKWKLVYHNYNVYRVFHKKNKLKASIDTVLFLMVQLFLKPKFILQLKK